MLCRAILFGLIVLLSTPSLMAQRAHADIHAFLDQWHCAATEARADAFFGAMSDNSIYIGTDATERWTKQEFIKFARPYFALGRAWDFVPYDRDVHITPDGSYVWFSELLTTWMGVCRGSGMLHKTKEGWEIEQYHLSVTVPNALIKDFISLIQKSTLQRKQQ